MWGRQCAFATAVALGGCTALVDTSDLSGGGASVASDDAGLGDAGGGTDGAGDARDGEGGVVVTDASLDAPDGFASILVRCGAAPAEPVYTDSMGRVWSNDTGFDTGTTISNSANIANTSDPQLYRRERFTERATTPNGFSYTFGSVPSGDYVVVLHFAETFSFINGPNQRKFNVLINGTQVLTELDIYAEAGKDRALDKTFPVTVQGPPLVLQFKPGTLQNPKVNAIEVLKR